ncbi:MAG: DNA primase [Actinomycetota bacterium]
MAGRIRDEDVAAVRERAAIADVVAEQVTLRNAGGGSLKGLCPFHEEKSPSFHVTPARGMFHCFGCGEGGDVISFVMKADHLPFAEAVERLAARAGVRLRYEEGGAAPGRQQGQRTRLVDAHRAAAEFYAEQLAQAEAAPARRFLAERGFDAAAAARFGLGYAPRGWDALVRHLRGRGFTDRELVAGGLAREGPRGLADRFVGRLLWPVRELSGEVVGFGARRLYDDDRVEAKYLNTPETPLYKKSQLLYGLDLARREVARTHQVVVVEGYTDVMACHLAGVGTAVATCGTAFGAEHIRVLRRLLADQHDVRGEVVFTFDGDAAGQRAALRAFDDDQKFVAQTFVAVEPEGRDPCELRQQQGDEAVRALVAARVPLFEFAVRSVLQRYDLDTTEGRLAALDAAAPIVARIRDHGLRQRYAVNLDRWLGLLDEQFVLRRVAEQARGAAPGARRTPGPAPAAGAASLDRAGRAERLALQVALQHPDAVGAEFDALDGSAFTVPVHRVVAAAIRAAGGVAGAAGRGRAWLDAVLAGCPDQEVRALVTELVVAPRAGRDDDAAVGRYARDLVVGLKELAADRRTAELKSRLSRLDPVAAAAEYAAVFAELVALEQQRRALREPSATR